MAGAKKAMPDIDLKVLRLSTGDLGARILAEAANPQNDVIWAWALTNVLDPRVLSEWVLADRLPVRVQLQVHKYIWGPDVRGV